MYKVYCERGNHIVSVQGSFTNHNFESENGGTKTIRETGKATVTYPVVSHCARHQLHLKDALKLTTATLMDREKVRGAHRRTKARRTVVSKRDLAPKQSGKKQDKRKGK